MRISRSKTIFSPAAAAALAAAVGSAAWWSAAQADDHNLSQSAAPAAVTGAPSFANLIAHVAPAVVSIDVERRGGRQDVGFSEGQDFGGRTVRPSSSCSPSAATAKPRAPRPSSTCSRTASRPSRRRKGRGHRLRVFISRDGYIVTNNHVVEGATKITVRMADKRRLRRI